MSKKNIPSAGRHKRTGIRDVAALAEVSVGTVSNTINRPDTVRKHTREAVERAIKELNFIPNQQARVLTVGTSQILGLIVQDIVSPFFMEVARAVEEIANENGHVLVLSNSDNQQERESKLIEMLTAQQVRGVLLTPAAGARHVTAELINDLQIPVVYLDYKVGGDQCSVSVDHVAGGRMAMQHLLDLGHEKFAFVGDSELLHQFGGRFRGAQEALSKAGYDPAKDLLEVKVPALGIQDGYLAAEKMLASEVPSGVVCGNDLMAFGVYRALTSAGVRIPEDVALIGYDDIDFAADWILPLTSVRQPTAELGTKAAELLFEHTSGDPSHVHQQVVLTPELIVRASTGRSA